MNDNDFLDELLKRVGNSLGNIGDNTNINQGRDLVIHNTFVGKLKRAPRNVRVMAIMNYTLLYFLMAFIIGFIFFITITFSLHLYDNTFFKSNGFILFLTIGFSALLGAAISVSFFEKKLLKIRWGHVLYKNKTIIYNLKREKFYDDIWDIELKETWLGHGKLRYFGIHKVSNKPYSRKITVMDYAQAKYIYDSFWNVEKIEEFKKKGSFLWL